MTDTPVADLDLLTWLFETRANRLKWGAWAVFAMILGLLIFGGYIVYQAPSLTSKDISSNFENRRAETASEIAKLLARRQEVTDLLKIELKGCADLYHNFFEGWEKRRSAEKPEDNAFHPVWFEKRLPNGSHMSN